MARALPRLCSQLVRTVLLAATVALTVQCRSVHAGDPDDASDSLSSASDRAAAPWFGPDGIGAPCEPEGQACTSYIGGGAFVDRCVQAGFKARTCGCTVRCSGRLEPLPAGAATLPADVAEPPQSGAPVVCSAASLALITKAAASRKPGSPLDRCIKSHVCSGDIHLCGEADLQVTRDVRAAARSGCAAEAEAALCSGGFTASLDCSDASIGLLSAEKADFPTVAVSVRQCLRTVICGTPGPACAPADRARGDKIKAAIARGGCGYWHQSFCALTN